MDEDFASLLEGLTPAGRGESGGWTGLVPESWLQGRTAYGGFTSALALELARRALPEPMPLASAQFAMIAPLAGPIEGQARIVRQGRNATWVTAQLGNARGCGFIANCVFMHPRESALAIAGYAPPPGVVPVAEAPALDVGHLPSFMERHFSVREALPGGSEADLCWWVRLNHREGLSGEVEAVLVGDALPPAVLPHLPRGTPVSSMQWHVNRLGADAVPADDWWLIRSTSRHCAQGLASEDIVQWGANGAPVIAGVQSVAVFG
ncbi:thioesterase family protein [Novosphingobium sp. 1949]|uniref:Thioesterase family protein n=1 Tax=Novosphingobium organovorum TaxID=2930092 RepID=A0ABT0BDB4_9SPHN|nr:thioesterase family protein [Novosphingobium organovorum]MCJ2183041.1 thioesterase family protein [Novosphingobium organovorum]